MKTRTQIKTIADGIYAEAVANINKFLEVRATEIDSLKGKSVSEQASIVANIVLGVEAQVVAPMVNGVSLPAHLTNISVADNGTDATEVIISSRSKLKAVTKYRKDTVVAVDSNFIKNAGSAIIDALFELFYIEVANENIEALNAKVEGICKDNEIPYTFAFALEPDNSAMVLSISDEKIVFNASNSAALDIPKMPLFAGGDEYYDLIGKEAEKSLIDSLKVTQTTTQLIKAKISVIDTITDVATKKRAVKLIRQAYHRQAKNLDSVKAGIGYFNEEVTIAGNPVEIFALVEKAEDGSKKVILKPFDVKTNLVVDYDVIAAL